MYFVVKSLEQEVITALGSSVPVPCKLATVAQSKFANCVLISSETPGTGVAAVAVSVAEGSPKPDARTCRNLSSAV